MEKSNPTIERPVSFPSSTPSSTPSTNPTTTPAPIPGSSPSVTPSSAPTSAPSPSSAQAAQPQQVTHPEQNTSTPQAVHGGKKVFLDRLQASVNSDIILYSDIKEFRSSERLRAQLDPLFAGTPVATHGDQASTSEIVDFLIDEDLISQQFPKDDKDTEQEINSIQANNHLDRQGLMHALEEQGFNFDQYFKLIKVSASKRDLIDRDIRTKVTISDDDVKNFYYNHYIQNKQLLRSYHLEIISVTSKSYPQAAAKVAHQALDKIRAGDSFEEVAKQVSDHPSAPSGGDLGYLSEGQLQPFIRDELKKLQIGKVSDIFGNAGNYYILKLIDIKSDDADQMNKVKEQIRAQLSAAEYQRQITLWLERQKQTAFIHRAGEPTIKGLPTVK